MIVYCLETPSDEAQGEGEPTDLYFRTLREALKKRREMYAENPSFDGLRERESYSIQYVVRGSVACLLAAGQPPAHREWLAKLETAGAQIRGAYGPEALAGLPAEYLTGGGAQQGGEDSGAAARAKPEPGGVCGCCGAPRAADSSMIHDAECIWHPSRGIDAEPGLSPY